MIFVDSREPSTIRARVQAACGLEQCRVKLLQSGDFSLFDADGCSLGIERKTVSDLLGSMASHRLDRQLALLRDYYSLPCLLIEGLLKMSKTGKVLAGKRETSWHHASVQGYLWAWQTRGIRVLWTGGGVETADLVRVLYQRSLLKCLTTSEPYLKKGVG